MTRKGRPKWTQERMNCALAEIQAGSSIRSVSKIYGIPRGTIQDRLHDRVENGTTLGRPTKLSMEEERKLVEDACNRASHGIGFTKKSFLR